MQLTPARPRTRALAVALLAVLLVAAWQWTTVTVNYRGNWTGLFRIGYRVAMPDALARGAFRNGDPIGYDGQYYRILAHDPFLRSGGSAYLDNPILRSRRILVPLAAWLLAAGQPALIDGAYIFVILGFIFAGTYWLARIRISQGGNYLWGLSFLAVPPVLVAVDSMTVDVAIAALAAGFAWHFITGRISSLWFILAAAGLVRETGVLLPAACICAAIYKKDFRKAALWGTTVIPVLCWYGYLHAVSAGGTAGPLTIPNWVIPQLEPGILPRMLDPVSYPQLSPHLAFLARGLDELALVSTVAAAVLAMARLRSVRPNAQKAALILQVLLMLDMTRKDFWYNAYGFSRPFAPLFVLPMAGDRPGAALLMAFFVDLRVLAELHSQIFSVLHRVVSVLR